MSKHFKTDLQCGDVASVKKGVKDPDFDQDISGWRGRIDDIYKNDEGTLLVMIDWDSVTLRNIHISQIIECQKKEMDWDRMVLEATEVELSEMRDSEEDVLLEKQKILDKLSNYNK